MPVHVKEFGHIADISELINELEKRDLASQDEAHVRFWFRGQERDDWSLAPAVFRPTFRRDTNEKERLRIERHLTQDFCIDSAGLRGNIKTIAHIYVLEQHYRMPTRLLDWTTSPLAAVYFAVQNQKEDSHDGALFLMDAYQIKNRPVGTEGVSTTDNQHFHDALTAIFHWDDKVESLDFVMAIRPDRLDMRVSFQRSCFTFHSPLHPALTTPGHNPTLGFWRIKASAKSLLRRQLATMSIDDFAIFGDLDSLASKLKKAYRVS